MNYPHWFTYLIIGDMTLPCAVMLISEAQANCAVSKYVELKELDGHVDPFVRYESLDALLHGEGLAKSDLIILSDDDRGKCIAFNYCDEPGGRCDIDYYDCGCFI